MLPSKQGAFRLFSAFGIQVFLHWSWFIVAYWRFENGKAEYQNPAWMLGEYITLFAIVLMHEFGHALACRSVGGSSEEIILWPFGGVAFVRPPLRPGAFLWSIAAGPLVNVALVPILFAANYLVFRSGSISLNGDFPKFLETIQYINAGMLIFNLMPVYPLDGGQIFQSILWFFIGYPKSVLLTAGLGMALGLGVAIFAFSGKFILFLGFAFGGFWLGFIAIFLLSQSWRSFQNAREILKYEKDQRDGTVIDI